MSDISSKEILQYYKYYLKEKDLAYALMRDYFFEDAFKILTGMHLPFFYYWEEQFILVLPEKAESLRNINHE